MVSRRGMNSPNPQRFSRSRCDLLLTDVKIKLPWKSADRTDYGRYGVYG
jgi:hypothetical protein